MEKVPSTKLPYPKTKTGTLKTNPFVMIMGGLPLASEYRLMYELTSSLHTSQQVGFSYLGRTLLYRPLAKQLDSTLTLDVVFRGFRLQYMYKIFIGRQDYAPEGWYLGPIASYATGRLSLGYWMSGGRYIEMKQGYCCMTLGRQARIGGRLTYDVFIGMGYKKNRLEQHYPNAPSQPIELDSGLGAFYYSNFKFCTGMNFGLMF